MSKREIVLVVDVETCGSIGAPLVYDLGIAVVVRATGEILESHSLIIDEVFYGMERKMRSAFYASKLPQYHERIASGDYRVVSFWQAWRVVNAILRYYGIHKVYAYNAAFDRRALNHTMRAVTSHGRWFFGKSTRFGCIWGMACQTVLSQKGFRKFATANGFVSPAGNLRTSAEVCYAYMTKNPHFEESHTGLEDVQIEVAIMTWCLRQHKKMSDRVIWNPWRIPQRVGK